MNSPYLKALGATIFCTVASFVVTWLSSNFLTNSFPPEAVVTAIVVPLVIATPLSILVCLQQNKIDLARRDLQAALLEVEEMHRDAERRAQTDLMTGVYNREHFIQTVSGKRGRNDVGTFFMLDADKFKSINDTWGHHAGDEALIAIAQTIEDTVRDGDVVGRLGGEEFGVFLPGTPLKDGLAIAERLRENIEKIVFEPTKGHIHKITASMGAAELREEVSVADMMKDADEFLYQAKENGRNRVVSQLSNLQQDKKAA